MLDLPVVDDFCGSLFLEVMARDPIAHVGSVTSNSSLRRERVLVLFLIFSICLCLAHMVHNGWYSGNAALKNFPPAPGTPIYFLFETPPPPLYAPEAYRVAIPALGMFLLKTTGIHDPSIVAAGLDFLFAVAALYLLYRVLTDRLTNNRALIVAMFLLFSQFSLQWVIALQRPETLPSAFFVAGALFCLLRSWRSHAWTALLLALTVFQAFVRSDVAFVFGIALVLLSLINRHLEELGTRFSCFARGIGITLIAGGVQVYLQFVRFPHLHYWPGTDVIQIKNNLLFHNLSNGIIALFPLAILIIVGLIKREAFSGVDLLILCASGLYLLLWSTVGLLDEVRIYVPFLLALSVVAARFATSLLMGEDTTGRSSKNLQATFR